MLVVQSHWGLEFSPFPAQPGRDAFFAASPHEEALARLHYVVDHGHRVSIVEGDSGSGKTLVTRVHHEESLDKGNASAWLNVRGATEESLREMLAALWTLPGFQTPSWERLGRRVQELMLERQRVVLTLDDADFAAPDALEGIRGLLDRSTSEQGTLTIVAASHAARSGRLRGRLYELGDLRIELAPWSAQDTADFLAGSLSRAGASDVFELDAIAQIHELSLGMPRDICRFARLALLATASENANVVTSAIVDSVADELVST